LLRTACAAAQTRLAKIGVVTGGGKRASGVDALLSGLGELGYVPGQNILVEHISTYGRAEHYVPAVETLLKVGVDVLVVSSTHGLKSARALTQTLPTVVIDLESDPLTSGAIASLARPGGNITGFFLDVPISAASRYSSSRRPCPV
jgi:putative ABC transport system substrate-binding protein